MTLLSSQTQADLFCLHSCVGDVASEMYGILTTLMDKRRFSFRFEESLFKGKLYLTKSACGYELERLLHMFSTQIRSLVSPVKRTSTCRSEKNICLRLCPGELSPEKVYSISLDRTVGLIPCVNQFNRPGPHISSNHS